MKRFKQPTCPSCGDKFTLSTAEDESHFDSAMCEQGRYPFPNKHRSKEHAKKRRPPPVHED